MASNKSTDDEELMSRDLDEARQRALNALKTSFINQRDCGLIPDDAVTVFNQAIKSVQDEQQATQIA